MRSKCLVHWFLVASLNQYLLGHIDYWLVKNQEFKKCFLTLLHRQRYQSKLLLSMKGVESLRIQLFKGLWKSRNIPGLYFWESRGQDFEKIPGSRRGLVKSPKLVKMWKYALFSTKTSRNAMKHVILSLKMKGDVISGQSLMLWFQKDSLDIVGFGTFRVGSGFPKLLRSIFPLCES